MCGIWFTSDTHFGHYREPGTGILKHQAATRPFATGEEMDAALLANINDVVGRNDTLYHLGDFCWQASKVGHYRARINCRKVVLLCGNHDKSKNGLRKYFSAVEDLLEINVDDQPIVLCHYALRVWNRHHYGAWHLYGHSHGSLPGIGMSMDVGVDCWGLRPVSFERIAATMQGRQQHTVDHHVSEHIKEVVRGEAQQAE